MGSTVGLVGLIVYVVVRLIWLLGVLLLVMGSGKLFLQWRANEAAPVVRVDAMVVSSRKRVARRRRAGVDPSTYMVTFEEPSGERLELQIRGVYMADLTEGVQGLLTYQGTRFLGFVRHDAVDGQR